MKSIILGSTSPRRQELMAKLHKPYISIAPNCDEILNNDLKLPERIEDLAYQKAKSVLDTNPDAIVIGCDTVVSLDGEILGKPKSIEDARKMLNKLSNNTHQVITSVAIISSEKKDIFSTITDVIFYPLDNDMIQDAIDNDGLLDKAGAYSIQGQGALFIKEIKGDYYSIMGLPVSELNRRLKEYETL